MSEILVEVTRGSVVESLHRGDIAVVDVRGRVARRVGDPEKYTYMRSCAKPLQALNVVLSGACDRYGFDAGEIAVMCSSHYGENFHLAAVRSILAKIGLSEAYLLGGEAVSLKPEYALEAALRGFGPSAIMSDCSGKHAGMLAVCAHRGYPVDEYLSPDSPCQAEILSVISTMCGIDRGRIGIGVDGCSVPVHAMPLRNMALGFARLANPDSLSTTEREACERIFAAMNARPEMISGTGGFCSDLIRAGRGALVGKIGAEGVYCVGLKGAGIGMAVKIESGSMAVLPPVVTRVLEALGALDPSARAGLSRYVCPAVRNDRGLVVGETRAVFDLAG